MPGEVPSGSFGSGEDYSWDLDAYLLEKNWETGVFTCFPCADPERIAAESAHMLGKSCFCVCYCPVRL